MSKDLPSIDDFAEDNSNLPSINDFITEENAEELPSVEDFIEKEEEVLTEATQTIEDAEGNSFAEVKDIIPPWPELVKMVNDVRADIPDIPEIKYYDKELEELAEQISQIRGEIPEVPEVRYYEKEVEAICEQIDLVRNEIKDLPEVKYYDEQVDAIEDRIDTLQTEVTNLPEVKYYDKEIEAICSAIDQVRSEIPTFPKWVNEVNEVPDFSWIGKTFSVIDDDFIKVNDTIDTLKENIQIDIKKLIEDNEVKHFENRVQFGTEVKDLDTKLGEEKEKIWKELRDSSMKIWEYHKEFKDDDKKLKKQILGEYNSLKQNIKKELKEVSKESVKTDELLLKYFTDLRKEVSEIVIPEVKDYDDDLRYIRADIKDLRKLVRTIKNEQKNLSEGLLNEPPSEKESVGGKGDPLTPMDQNFATLDDLASHYRLFINRIQQQISTIGGGGAGFIKDLDDVTFDQTTGTNKLLIYNGSKWVGIASTAIGGGGDANAASKLVLDVRNQNIGYGLTIGTPVYQVAYNSGQDRLDVEESRASDSTTMPAKGVVSADLANNTNGQIIVYGELEGVNTQAFDVGDELFVAPGGGLTNVRPTDPTHLVQKIAVVLKKSTANGAILVYGAGRTNDVPNNISIAGSVTAADGFFSGNVSVAGTITYEDVTNVDSLGLGTFRSGLEVQTGTATTALLVQGDARVTGILTVGTASVTIDGDNNKVSVGIVTITNSEVVLGDNVTLNAAATGINSAPNVLYVAKDGSDSNNGTSIDNAFLTIAGAVGAATSGTVVKVLSGNYVESNPIEVPAFVAVVGDDLRTVKVLPSTTTSDIFHVNKGCKLANMTFSGHVAPAAAVAFPTGIATNVGGGKWKGPYIQNCTSDTTTGTGIYIDGNLAEKTKSMNVDAFTQYNQGGVGVAITNEGYAQLVSVFTICCDKAITVHKGGQADLANSNCSFGTQGLVADGVSPEQFTGIVTASAAASQDNVTIDVGAGTTRPYDGQVVYFDELYKSVETITVGSGGTGYTQAPTVTIDAPTGPSGETASAFATIENGAVTEISIISSGSQYTTTPTITISGPQSGINTATATANMADTYYTINSATPIVSGITTLTLAENLINTVGVGSTAYFFQQSKIVASSHTFEYIGSGNTITLATPKRGGVTIQANEVVSQNGGRVIYTSTDQAGNFRIGDDLQINQATGTISGRAFSKSLFSEITPFILALS